MNISPPWPIPLIYWAWNEITLRFPVLDKNEYSFAGMKFFTGMMDTSNKRYTIDDIMKACAILDEYLLMDEQTQVAGWVIFEDFTGFGLQHSAFLGIENSRKMTTIFTVRFLLYFHYKIFKGLVMKQDSGQQSDLCLALVYALVLRPRSDLRLE